MQLFCKNHSGSSCLLVIFHQHASKCSLCQCVHVGDNNSVGVYMVYVGETILIISLHDSNPLPMSIALPVSPPNWHLTADVRTL